MKKIYIAIFVLAIVILLANSFLITPSSILDTDPSTYVIVPIIMIPLLAVFIFKKDIKINTNMKDVLFGFVLFVIFVFSIIYLRYIFSSMFIEFRLDLLLLPLAITSLVVTIFGASNVNVFKALIIYAFFASPLLLYPIFSLNQGFAGINAQFVYDIIHTLNNKTLFVPPISIVENNITIGIGESCVGIGVLIGLVFFLVPVAYLFEGNAKNKILWVFSGALLFIGLNFLRMLGIAITWFYYGPNASVSYIHMFVGMLIFYLVIIIMMLIAGLFKLKIQRVNKQKSKKRKERKKFEWITLLAIIYAVLYYVISMNYASSVYISPSLIFNKVALNGIPFENFISSNVNTTGYKAVSYAFGNSSDIILLTNTTFNSTEPLAMLITEPNKEEENTLFSNTIIQAKETYLDNQGLDSNVYKIYSNNTIFYIITKKQPYTYGNNYGYIMEYMIMPNSTGDLNIKCNYSYIYNLFYKLFGSSFYNVTIENELESAYCINEKIFK
ncbi:MAG: archaeosortase/exosortase family protein [Candidatus Micrarchaeia archaeon]